MTAAILAITSCAALDKILSLRPMTHCAPSTTAATLAIGSEATVPLFKEGSAQPAANRTAIVEFMVDDVSAEYTRLKDRVKVVHEPKLMPWGNRSVQFRDPEGTIVALFTPVTDDAKKHFGSR